MIVNIAKGRIGREAASLIGSLFLSHLHSILFQGTLSECNLYVDEFQSFGTDLIADMLSEDRKFGLNATLANQYFSQLSEANRDAVIGNVGTIVAFRIGSKDAAKIATEFNRDDAPFNPSKLINQPPFKAYVKRADHAAYTFSVEKPPPPLGSLAKVVERSRRRFARRLTHPLQLTQTFERKNGGGRSSHVTEVGAATDKGSERRRPGHQAAGSPSPFRRREKASSKRPVSAINTPRDRTQTGEMTCTSTSSVANRPRASQKEGGR